MHNGTIKKGTAGSRSEVSRGTLGVYVKPKPEEKKEKKETK